jgi:hypothetical protein
VHASPQADTFAATHIEVGKECLGHLRPQVDSWR